MFNTIFSVIASVVVATTSPTVLATHNYSLSQRYPVAQVNQVFTDNILLTLFYMNRQIKEGDKVPWETIKGKNQYTLQIKPGETFAFHDNILPKYKGKISSTTNAHFSFSQGFESDGWLIGDGVCHLASFMNVLARQAGLTVEAPTRHDFAVIPGVSRENGVAILYSPNNNAGSAQQNLYITNNKDKTVDFVFNTDGKSLDIQVVEEK